MYPTKINIANSSRRIRLSLSLVDEEEINNSDDWTSDEVI